MKIPQRQEIPDQIDDQILLAAGQEWSVRKIAGLVGLSKTAVGNRIQLLMGISFIARNPGHKWGTHLSASGLAYLQKRGFLREPSQGENHGSNNR